MKYVLVNYNYTPEWLKDYTDDYLIYDRSDSKEYLKDFDQDKIIYTENRGNVDYDKLSYLVDNYDNLPDVFVWGKTNLFKFITPEEFEKVKNNTTFTPLLTMGHKTYQDRLGQVCFYHGGMYNERNDSWYFGSMEYHFLNYGEVAAYLNIPSPAYLPFAPGGNYILTKETVHKYSRDFYKTMMDILPYCQLPAEAHALERSYYSIWS